MNKRLVLSGAILITVAIILGAFGAHALKEMISVERLVSFETGVRYQVYHGIALLVLGANAEQLLAGNKWVSRLIITGVLLFSGSIYFLALQEPLHMSLKFLGPVTPIGGMLMIIGWVIFILKIIKK